MYNSIFSNNASFSKKKGNLLGGGGAAVELGGDSGDLSLQVVVGRVDLGLVLDQEGAEDAVVDGDSALFDGQGKTIENGRKAGETGGQFKETVDTMHV